MTTYRRKTERVRAFEFNGRHPLDLAMRARATGYAVHWKDADGAGVHATSPDVETTTLVLFGLRGVEDGLRLKAGQFLVGDEDGNWTVMDADDFRDKWEPEQLTDRLTAAYPPAA